MLTASDGSGKPRPRSIGAGPVTSRRESPSPALAWARAARRVPPQARPAAHPRAHPGDRPGARARRPVRHPGAPRPTAALGRAPGARRRARLLGGAQGPAHRPGHRPAGRAHRGPPDGVPGVLRRDPGRRVRRRLDDHLGHRHLPRPRSGTRARSSSRCAASGPAAASCSSTPAARAARRTGCCAARTRRRTASRSRTTRVPATATPGPLPRGDGWWLQVGFGGRRVIVRVEGGRARITDAEGCRAAAAADAARARAVAGRDPGAAGRPS